MSLWSRVANVFRGDRLSREIDEELASHIEEAVQQGRDRGEARRAFGSPLRQRESSHDAKVVVWLDSLRADAVFGWRQLKKRKATSAAAILSLGLAIGACTAAFRIVDALLLRPLPIAHPERLYALSYQQINPEDGKLQTRDASSYPMFREMRAAVRDQAELLAISYAASPGLTYGADEEMERPYRQYVSGWMFDSLGIRPALGRLLTANDDLKPSAAPVAVLSYDYWNSRFGRDPKIIGRTFRLGNVLYSIVGVAGAGFTGTEPGKMVDIFVPTMMMGAIVNERDSFWFRTLVLLKPGVGIEPVREKLHAAFQAFWEVQVKKHPEAPKQFLDSIVSQKVLLEPAASGVSETQRDYSQPLTVLSVLVALVLLIACANMANLMTAQAAGRAREMALRVSIGAGRRRLMQLVLVESGILALFAAAAGVLFAIWAGPFVVNRINPPNNPVRLLLPADWRVLGFGLALTLGVTLLFGLAPALRASRVRPADALKSGGSRRRRLMHPLIAVQAAFCFLVLFVAGLFIHTFERLSHHPTGFSAERLLILDAGPRKAEPAVYWAQVAEHLRSVPGVENVALASWPLLTGGGWSDFISIDGGPPSHEEVSFLQVSPGWLDTMKIPLIAGRDFRSDDAYPKVAIVNQAFAKRYFSGENPLGQSFSVQDEAGKRNLEIVGLSGDALYFDIHKPVAPVAYFPFQTIETKRDAKGELMPPKFDGGTFIVRTSSANQLALAPTLRQEVTLARPEFRVNNIQTQQELIDNQTIRERLLAMLALFFAVVALLLAGVGLYGVLDYSVLQRRREIGIRIAVGAQPVDIVRRVTLDVFAMVLAGALVGLALGIASARYIESLLYRVKATEGGMLALPSLAILAAVLLAAIAPVIRAVRIDPVETLRSE
jgi:putative ABC transport system permease protein